MDFPLKRFRFVFDKYMFKGIKVIVMHHLESWNICANASK